MKDRELDALDRWLASRIHGVEPDEWAVVPNSDRMVSPVKGGALTYVTRYTRGTGFVSLIAMMSVRGYSSTVTVNTRGTVDAEFGYVETGRRASSIGREYGLTICRAAQVALMSESPDVSKRHWPYCSANLRGTVARGSSHLP
jgi:hypothetical protein